MLGTQNLSLFILSGILLNLTPGQDTLYILGRSIAHGRRAGFLSVLGISSGCLIHTITAAFGLSAMLAASASAFLIVKFAGAVYLAYLGIRMLLDRSAPVQQPPGKSAGEGAWAIYRAGVLTNVLNPKVALFFLAFLPQFVDPAADAKIVGFLFLGALFIFTGTIWCLIVAWGASAVCRQLRQNTSTGLIVRRVTGAFFVGMGFRLAFKQ